MVLKTKELYNTSEKEAVVQQGDDIQTIHFEVFKTIPFKYANGVRSLLNIVDDDFEPPLSIRKGGLDGYMDVVLPKPCVLALINDEVIGALLWVPHADMNVVNDATCTYIKNVSVLPEYRGLGIGNRLYELCEINMDDECILVQTWSTNKTQDHLLTKRGYKEIMRVENDRGHNIDTVFYRK